MITMTTTGGSNSTNTTTTTRGSEGAFKAVPIVGFAVVKGGFEEVKAGQV
jgi:hypothetical protein